MTSCHPILWEEAARAELSPQQQQSVCTPGNDDPRGRALLGGWSLCLLTPSLAHSHFLRVRAGLSGQRYFRAFGAILGRALRHRGQAEGTGFGSCFQSRGWVGMGCPGGTRCREALGCPQPKESPKAAVVVRRAGKMPVSVQHGGELRGAPRNPQEYFSGAGTVGSASGEQQLVAQAWGFLPCVFRAAISGRPGREWFSEKPPGSSGQAVRGRCHLPAGRASSRLGAQPWPWQRAAWLQP